MKKSLSVPSDRLPKAAETSALDNLTTGELRVLAQDRGIVRARSMGRYGLLRRLRGQSTFSSRFLIPITQTLLFPFKVVPVLLRRLGVSLRRPPVARHDASTKGPQISTSKASAVSDTPDPSAPSTQNLVRYRGLTFSIDGEYSPVYDEKRIVRGIWYRDPDNIKDETRNRMVAAVVNVTQGLTVLESDYALTLVGGMGGIEHLQNPGGAILWFASARKLFGN